MSRMLLSRVFFLALSFGLGMGAIVDSARAEGPQLAHMVFFTLKDDSESSRKALMDGCKTYLSGHDNAVYFSVGTRAKEMDRDVNVKDFDVALHLVFANKAAHDAYQTSPRHLKFIEENGDLWESVRVFDSLLETEPEHSEAR